MLLFYIFFILNKMRRTNPFDNNITNNSINNNNLLNNQQSNQSNNLFLSKSRFQNQLINDNEQNYIMSQHPKNISTIKKTDINMNDNIKDNKKSFYQNNNYDENDEEYNLIKNEFELKIKPFNCSINYISPITNIFPSNINTYNQLSLPLGISLCPMYNSGIDIPLIDYGDKVIPRCTNANCGAYLNPFIDFIDGGEKWVCNICNNINKTEEHYYCNLDENGIRLDKNKKAELCCGSYEFVLNQKFCKKDKKPTEASFIFIFETSLGAINNGFLSACIESIKNAIINEIFYNGNNIKISIITYNIGIDFYSYNNKFTQPQMLTVNDEQIFLPTNENNLIFNLKTDKNKILQILDLIQNTFNRNNQHIINNCKDSLQIFTAIVAAYLLGNNNGGKILVFSNSNKINTIKLMNEGLDKNATKEQNAYSTHDNNKLGNMGINLTNKNMSCDIFASSDNQIDILTLYQLCEYSNGHLYFYKKFNFDLHYKNIFNQIRRVLSRPICWEGLNITRYSNGYKLSSYSTPILITKTGLFVFPTGDSDQNYLFSIAPSPSPEKNEIKNNNYINYNKNKKSYLYIQNALLYSFGDSTLRIRIHNLCLPLSSNIRHIYKEINSELLANFYIKNT